MYIYAKLREWRKEAAVKESVPVYTIFKNDQLAQIVEKRINKTTDLSQIEGVGKARANKKIIGVRVKFRFISASLTLILL